MASSDDSVHEWMEQARRQGWRVERSRNGHWKFYPADRSIPPLSVAYSPSDHRTRLNERAALRRRGLEI